MMKKKTKNSLTATDLLFAAGAALISTGVGLLACFAAGLIVLGGFSLAAAWMADQTAGEDGDRRA